MESDLENTAVQNNQDTNGVAAQNNGAVVEKNNASDYPVADFYESVQYNWDETSCEVQRALKWFSEHTHGNY